MRTWRASVAWWLAIGAIGGLRADPEQDLRHAVEKLWGAGNYTWEEKHIINFDSTGRMPRRMPSFGTGETIIGGYTLATIQRRKVVFLGSQTAFQLKASWRHALDLTEAEIQELGFLGFGSPAAVERARHYTRPLAHELLRMFLERGTNFRKEGPAIVGDFAGSLYDHAQIEQHVQSGTPLPPARRPVSSRPARDDPSRSSGFVVWIENGVITELSTEFRRDQNISFNGGEKERHNSTRTFKIKLTNIGTTKVEVDPVAAALFLQGTTAGR